jgi:hypothetical protein
MKAGIISLLIFTLCSLFPSLSFAQEISHSSASFADIVQAQQEDDRVVVLKKFLQSHNSPMASNAEDFVIQADINHIPWHLVAAIAGTESTFGQHEPTSTCHNGWGYGVYGTNVLCFPTYTDAIKTISKALRDVYIDKFGATDVYGIGKYYAASPTWGDHTSFFMHQIEDFKQEYEASALPISL